jgi:hypothetical protein
MNLLKFGKAAIIPSSLHNTKRSGQAEHDHVNSCYFI